VALPEVELTSGTVSVGGGLGSVTEVDGGLEESAVGGSDEEDEVGAGWLPVALVAAESVEPFDPEIFDPELELGV
jgi:hypothetical protein